MGIDGIGKPGSGAPPGRIDPSAAAGESEAVGAAERGAAVESAGGSEALERLGRGELTLDAYLETHVAAATAHLEGRLSPEQLDFVRGSLREQLATDPVLVQLVRRATGAGSTEPGR
jgi:hypothetical protein